MRDPILDPSYVWPCGATNFETQWIGRDLYYADPKKPLKPHTEEDPYWHHRYYPKLGRMWDSGVKVYCKACVDILTKDESALRRFHPFP